jgi:hypothetical protein
MNTKNSCNNRGCRTLILTHDSKPKPIFGEVLRKRHASKAVLSLFSLPLDKIEVKKAA